MIDCNETKQSVSAALRKALRCRPKPGATGPYGTEKVGPKIADILACLPRDDTAALTVDRNAALPSFRRKIIAY